jgi:hypothetical protein
VKATIDIPDDLYRRVKAKSALEGKRIREVAVELFRRYVSERGGAPAHEIHPEQEAELPPWFGVLGKYAAPAKAHDRDEMLESVARGIAAERGLQPLQRRAPSRARRKV